MALCVPHALVISVSSMEHDLLDQLLDEFEIHDDQDADPHRPVLIPPAHTSTSASTPSSSVSTPVEAKPIRLELDPLPLATEDRTEYFTVANYVWPTPKKRLCSRMPDEERRQRHRESQREFMTRKRSQFRAMRAEISHLESQVRWLEARRSLKTLTLEQQSLQAKLTKVVTNIRSNVWKEPSDIV